MVWVRNKFPSKIEKNIYLFLFFIILLIVPTFLLTSLYLMFYYTDFIYNSSPTIADYLDKLFNIYTLDIIFTILNTIILSTISILIYRKIDKKVFFWRSYIFLLVVFCVWMFLMI